MKTIKASELSKLAMVSGGESKITRVIRQKIVHHVYNWVGIGWVDEGEATEADKEKYPLVVGEATDSELVDALALALAEAENWIHDGLDGTSQLKGALRKLAPARRVLKKYRP